MKATTTESILLLLSSRPSGGLAGVACGTTAAARSDYLGPCSCRLVRTRAAPVVRAASRGVLLLSNVKASGLLSERSPACEVIATARSEF